MKLITEVSFSEVAEIGQYDMILETKVQIIIHITIIFIML